MTKRIAAGLLALLLPATALAADDLPLLQGSYTDVNTSCKGALPGNVMSYAGGNKAPSPPQIDCTIQQDAKNGNTHNLTSICIDPTSGHRFPLTYTIVIKDTIAFAINGHNFRYCGRTFQF